MIIHFCKNPYDNKTTPEFSDIMNKSYSSKNLYGNKTSNT